MLDRVVLQDGETRRDADSVVRSERSTRSTQVTIDDTGDQGIRVKVDAHIIILLDNHIHVTLQTDGGLHL